MAKGIKIKHADRRTETHHYASSFVHYAQRASRWRTENCVLKIL